MQQCSSLRYTTPQPVVVRQSALQNRCSHQKRKQLEVLNTHCCKADSPQQGASSSSPAATRASPVQRIMLTTVQTLAIVLTSFASPTTLVAHAIPPPATEPASQQQEEQYFETVPQALSGSDESTTKEPNLRRLLDGAGVENCARKCVPSCLRGGQGSVGFGPMTMRKEIVVFKEGFRTRQYCLSECVQVCALQMQSAAKEAAAK